MDDIIKEALVNRLIKLDGNVLQVAVVYAESCLKHGVDITEKWETAVRQRSMLEDAWRRGFIEGLGTVVKCYQCAYWHTPYCKCEEEAKPYWYCANGHLIDKLGEMESKKE